MKLRCCASLLLFFITASLYSAPPEMLSVTGFLQDVEGPLRGLSAVFDGLVVLRPGSEEARSALVEPVRYDTTDFYRGDYLYGKRPVSVLLFSSEIGLAGILPWRVNAGLCPNRSLYLYSDGENVYVALNSAAFSIIVITDDSEFDACAFLNDFVPVLLYFNQESRADPSFPAALGKLP